MGVRFVDAVTEEHFALMSRIHALGWRAAYADAIPPDYMAREITDDRWIPFFRTSIPAGTANGLLVYDGEEAVCCATYGPVRLNAGPQAGTVCTFHADDYQGWGEVMSLYCHPDHTSKGYGSRIMEEMLRRLKAQGFPSCLVYVLQENEGARRFYARHGFAWDGTHEDIPFPPDTVCRDLRYTRAL